MAQNNSVTVIEPETDNHVTTMRPVPNLVRLRDLRMRAAMTQADLAERAGIARTTVIRLEAGDPNVNPSTLRKLARALRVKPAELWEERGS